LYLKKKQKKQKKKKKKKKKKQKKKKMDFYKNAQWFKFFTNGILNGI